MQQALSSPVLLPAASAAARSDAGRAAMAAPAAARSVSLGASKSAFAGACLRTAQAKIAASAPRGFAVIAADGPVNMPEKTVAKAPTKSKTYQVNLEKPLGVKFARGYDGGCYIISLDAARGSIDDKMVLGDKISKISASFGSDVWPAENYGQVMYAMKTRVGGIFMELESRDGDMDFLEGSDKDAAFKRERAGGNYGGGTKEVQQRNYTQAKEAARKRVELFNDALEMYQGGKFETALVEFENVLGLEPKNYIGDNFSRVTDVYVVTQYNIACCYSKLGAVDAGLEALEDCLNCGFEDFKKVRKDPSVAELREDPRFKPLINRYDEPLINEGAIKAIKNIFGGTQAN